MFNVYSFLFSAFVGSVTVILYVVSPSIVICFVVVYTSASLSPMLTKSSLSIVVAVTSTNFVFWLMYALYIFPTGLINVPFTVTANNPNLFSVPSLSIIKVYSLSVFFCCYIYFYYCLFSKC